MRFNVLSSCAMISLRHRFMLWSFGKLYVPLIGYVKPKLHTLDDEKVVVKIPLSRRNKNHLSSMYFGALCVGADIAAGFHGLYHSKKENMTISLAFKSFQSEFIRRPESDVYFVNDMGQTIKTMLIESKAKKERINQPIKVKAYTNYPNAPEEVAQFTLTLSLKVLS